MQSSHVAECPGVTVFAMLRVPLYLRAVGAQLSYPAHLQLGVSTAF